MSEKRPGPAQEAGAATLNYGLFINALINFLIVAFVIFLVVRAYNQATAEEEARQAEEAARLAEEEALQAEAEAN